MFSKSLYTYHCYVFGTVAQENKNFRTGLKFS